MYKKHNQNSEMLLLCLYVDDITYMESSLNMVREFKINMMRSFEMNDLGLLQYFLGLEVKQQEGSITVCQKKYAEDLFKRFGMKGSKSYLTPLNSNEKLQLKDSSRKVDEVSEDGWGAVISNPHTS